MLTGYPTYEFAGLVIGAWLVGFFRAARHDLNPFWVIMPFLLVYGEGGVAAGAGALLVCGMVDGIYDLLWAVDDGEKGQ